MAYRFALAAMALISFLAAGPAMAQSYYRAPVVPAPSAAELEARQRRLVLQQRARILAREEQRQATTVLTDGNRVDNVTTRNGLQTARQGTRSVPIAPSDNRSRLVPQR